MIEASKLGAGGLVSVIVAFHNSERFLQEAIESVLSQEYSNWELILVDDGSTDSSGEIARRFARQHPDKICCLQHPGHRNLGLCAARNVGLRHSRGAYIAILDSDDVWLPQKLQEQVALMEQYPQVGLVYGRSEYWYDWSGNDADHGKNHVPPLASGGRLYHPPELLKISYPLGKAGAPCPSDFLLRRQIVEQIGGFEESFGLEFGCMYEDQAFLTKVYVSTPVYVSDRCWDKYRRHDMSCSSIAERNGMAEVARRFYFEWLEEYLRRYNIEDSDILGRVARKTWQYRHPRLSAAGRRFRGIAKRVLKPGT